MAVRTYRDEYAARQRQVKAANYAARLSRSRYNGGVTSYLEVMITEQSQFSAELAESQTLRLYFNAIIELYKALGGGWVAPETTDEHAKGKPVPEGQTVDSSSTENNAMTPAKDPVPKI